MFAEVWIGELITGVDLIACRGVPETPGGRIPMWLDSNAGPPFFGASRSPTLHPGTDSLHEL